MNIQKKIIRLMTLKFYLEGTEPLFFKLKILNIFKFNNYITCLLIYCFKFFKNLPQFVDNYFSQNNEIHDYNTWNTKKFHAKYKGTNYAKHTSLLLIKERSMEFNS